MIMGAVSLAVSTGNRNYARHDPSATAVRAGEARWLRAEGSCGSGQMPAARRSSSTRSVRSQEKSGSSRPK